jgi:hypothetical protein
MVNNQRQNIRLVKVITYFSHGQDRLHTAIKPNSWSYADYSAPDFLAALVVSGMYYYCPNWPVAEGDSCPNAVLAPTNTQRQNPTAGGYNCPAVAGQTTPVCRAIQGPTSVYYTKPGNITLVPDGVSGATVYPGTPVNQTWNMRDRGGSLVEEGWYLVYVQMSAERFPRTMEYGEMDGSTGRVAVGMETCWDNPRYDTLGNHRVVRLLHFRDSAFTHVVQRETKWKGDTFSYLEGSMTFTYTTSATMLFGPQGARDAGHLQRARYDRSARAARLLTALPAGTRLGLYDACGVRVQTVEVGEDGRTVWLTGAGVSWIRPPSGMYFLRSDAQMAPSCALMLY